MRDSLTKVIVVWAKTRGGTLETPTYSQTTEINEKVYFV